LLERLASEAQEREFAAGAEIISEGEEADYLYALIEGAVEVTASGEDGGAARLIRTMEAPTYFGEIGILKHVPRTANVVASENCRCLLIDGQTLLDALASASPSSALLSRSASLHAVTHPSAAEPEEAAVAG
jgi:CRP-like cAMP-binding protein